MFKITYKKCVKCGTCESKCPKDPIREDDKQFRIKNISALYAATV
ncbi:MAG: 4Fe-4S binding protein [Lachnospiraceae bacterium]|nr:4Fe-4S binding protein [Lachnospiraceae bacterium]